ncbi:MAG: DNA repair exonuclease [Clostridiaceae bacterium]
MDRVRIIHAADFHFDSPFKELSGILGEKRNEDIKKTFESIIDKAREEQTNILLLCGDIFDNNSVKKSTLEFIKSQFETLESTKVFIAAGNHDPLGGSSFYRIFNWPDNVHIFSDEMETVVLEDIKTVVHGISFSSSYEYKSLLRDFKTDEKYKDYINIMALHGEITTSSGNEYNPVTLQEIGQSGLNYLALGHRHGFSGIRQEGETFYAYSGCPEGRGFDESGEKGIIIGEVFKEGVALDFMPLSRRTYNLREFDLGGYRSQEQLIKGISEAFEGENTGKNFYKIILTGCIDEEVAINIKTLHYRLKEQFYFLKIKDETKITLDLEEIRKENSLRGIFFRKMALKIEIASEEERPLLEEALKLGLEALREEEVSL